MAKLRTLWAMLLMALSGCAESQLKLPGDVNRDGLVGAADLNTVIANWGLSPATWVDGDITGDNLVSGYDYNQIVSHWGDAPFQGMVYIQAADISCRPQITLIVEKSTCLFWSNNLPPLNVLQSTDLLIEGLEGSTLVQIILHNWTLKTLAVEGIDVIVILTAQSVREQAK